MRKAVCLGGDADTQACIAGAIAEAFYGGVPGRIVQRIRKSFLSGRMLEIADAFDDGWVKKRRK